LLRLSEDFQTVEVNMRKPIVSSTLVLCTSIAVAACSHERPAQSASGYEPGMAPASGNTTATTTAPTTAPTTTPAARSAPSAPGQLGSEQSEALSDGQIAAVVRAINVAEIDQAKIAEGKAKEPSVKHFAETMIAHHAQAVKDVDELDAHLNLRPTDSQLVTELRVNATSVENKLSANDDPTFDKAYMMSQVDAHRQALDTIDSRLMPAVRSQDLRQMLETLRPRVANHLQMAQTILDTLK
jgi:putative membrane protein